MEIISTSQILLNAVLSLLSDDLRNDAEGLKLGGVTLRLCGKECEEPSSVTSSNEDEDAEVHPAILAAIILISFVTIFILVVMLLTYILYRLVTPYICTNAKLM